MLTGTIIIGAGISGLHTAYELAKRGQSFCLLEAKSDLGGRIYSIGNGLDDRRYDLGPSWFWPGQTNIEVLVEELGLQSEIYHQYASGDGIYETLNEQPRRISHGISMAGAYRLTGGLGKIIDVLEEKIITLAGDNSIIRGARVSEITFASNVVTAKYADSDDKKIITGESAVLALPARVAMHTLGFTPNLSKERTVELNGVSTWMAGHAKVVLVYEKPFWRDQGLSGDAVSQRGPLSEVHDASLANDNHFALFGFFATPPKHRPDNIDELEHSIVEQLARYFGQAAKSPMKIYYKDWARDDLVASPLDQAIANYHPVNHWSSVAEQGWEKRLIWSGSEAAAGQANGYIEGAIAASKQALAHLNLAKQSAGT